MNKLKLFINPFPNRTRDLRLRILEQSTRNHGGRNMVMLRSNKRNGIISIESANSPQYSSNNPFHENGGSVLFVRGDMTDDNFRHIPGSPFSIEAISKIVNSVNALNRRYAHG